MEWRYKHTPDMRAILEVQSGAFLAAAVWAGQWGGHIFIWGGGQEFRMT